MDFAGFNVYAGRGHGTADKGGYGCDEGDKKMRLVSRLRVIADEAPEAVSIALHDTADFILTLIRIYVAVDTGFLRDSYKKESLEQLHIVIGTMVSYSIFQEFGTSRQPGKPHVVPAFQQAGTFFEKTLAERVENLG
jgi:hypothetical protein